MQGDPRYTQLMAMANQAKDGGLPDGGNQGNMPPTSGGGDGPEMQQSKFKHNFANGQVLRNQCILCNRK